MKKLFVVMMAFVLGMAVTSCKQSPKAEGEGAQTEEAQADPQEVIKGVIEKATAEGANWTADQWKDAAKQVMIAVAPGMLKMNEIMKTIDSGQEENPDTAKLSKVMADLEEVGKELQPLGDLMEKFDSIAKTTEVGKAVLEDKEFEKELLKAAGLPKDFHM